MKWSAKASAKENARGVIPKLRRKYWKAGSRLTRKHLDFATLHKFRLKTKRYRYSLELFRDVEPEVEKELKKLKPVQDLLGEINDCASALDLIETAPGKHARFARYLRDRAAKKIAQLSSVLAD